MESIVPVQPYAVLFRGINVGGNKPVPMKTLREALSAAGFGQVQSYVQSGNVVLVSADSVQDVQAQVTEVFERTFGFPSRPTVRTAGQWHTLQTDCPFPHALAEPKSLHAILLDAAPSEAARQALQARATAGEQLVYAPGVLYLHTPGGFGRSEVAAQLDRCLKVPLTARNWSTVQAIANLLAAASGGAL